LPYQDDSDDDESDAESVATTVIEVYTPPPLVRRQAVGDDDESDAESVATTVIEVYTPPPLVRRHAVGDDDFLDGDLPRLERHDDIIAEFTVLLEDDEYVRNNPVPDFEHVDDRQNYMTNEAIRHHRERVEQQTEGNEAYVAPPAVAATPPTPIAAATPPTPIAAATPHTPIVAATPPTPDTDEMGPPPAGMRWERRPLPFGFATELVAVPVSPASSIPSGPVPI
jgi:hypothetical protein